MAVEICTQTYSQRRQRTGVGVLHIEGTTAPSTSAATLPQYRGLGTQTALLATRIQYAKDQGCQYAVSRTGRGSISQQNMEKLGMTIVSYSTAWRSGSALLPGV